MSAAVIVITLLAIVAIVCVLAPFVLMRQAEHGSAAFRFARYHAIGAGLVLAIPLCAMLGLSFAAHAANIAAYIVVLLAAGALVCFVFRLRPGWLGFPVGLAGILAWLCAVLAAMLDGSLNNYFPITSKLPGGLFCRESHWVAMSDQGRHLVLFHRFLFIDYSVFRMSSSDSKDDDDTAIPPAFAAAVASCRQIAARRHDEKAP